MRLRRVHLGSLLVVALALAGATVVSAREVSRTSTSITWQASEVRRTPVASLVERQAIGQVPSGATAVSVAGPRIVQFQVRHPLFQRPPPKPSSLTHIH